MKCTLGVKKGPVPFKNDLETTLPVSKIVSEAEFASMSISLSLVKKNYQLFNISFAIDKL